MDWLRRLYAWWRQPTTDIEYLIRETEAAAATYDAVLPPLEGLPRLTRVQIIDSVLAVAKPPPLVDPEVWLTKEVAKVEMADALGRALHRANEIGGPWGPPCSRPVGHSKDNWQEPDHFEPVPYGYEGGEYECECPQMGAHLVDLMEQDTLAQQPKIVTPKGVH